MAYIIIIIILLEDLDGRKLGPSDVLGCMHYHLSALRSEAEQLQHQALMQLVRMLSTVQL
jgi:hypothetical protein